MENDIETMIRIEKDPAFRADWYAERMRERNEWIGRIHTALCPHESGKVFSIPDFVERIERSGLQIGGEG